MRIVFFSVLLAVTIITGGCASVSVTTWKSPDFNIGKYRRVFINEDEETEGYLYDRMEDYLGSLGLKVRGLSSNEVITNQTIIAELNTTWGLSWPYGRPFPCNFTYPKLVTVELLDGVTRERLLITVYERSFYADITGESGKYTAFIINDMDKSLRSNEIKKNNQ